MWGHRMGRLRHGVPLVVLLSLEFICEGCGGSSSTPPPPPPLADFSLSLSSNSISIAQGAASSAVNVSVDSLNNFSGAVQVTLSALPSGVTSNPVSPFSVAAGRRPQRRRRFYRSVFVLPRANEPDGQPADHSARSSAGGP